MTWLSSISRSPTQSDETATSFGLGGTVRQRRSPLSDHQPARSDGYSVPLDGSDFSSGGLNQASRIRPNRIFTADVAIVAYRAGTVSASKLNEVVDRLIEILSQR